jgi:FlaA1/EpsC-like NDP-sugar epimerase
MSGNPWWWPKSQTDVWKLINRIERYRSDFRFAMLRQFAVIACVAIFAIAMSLTLVMLLLLFEKDVTQASLLTVGGVVFFGLVCARLVYQVDRDVFNEMAEVFVAVPLSSRTWNKLKKEFNIYP